MQHQVEKMLQSFESMVATKIDSLQQKESSPCATSDDALGGEGKIRKFP